VREGGEVTFVCKASGYPEPYVMWRREDGEEFSYNGDNGPYSTLTELHF
jgi:neurotrimin